ncbi:ribonucleases P/MRP protein subunit POP1-like [Paramacrobiotus metropolitanus]|uniref:ribonucleases P/MRP protein subunit POP1-like n=1 Tax=Paramacrobiotus metropolitanus TaxID=2943436 RepID=UPI002445A857|nr:ribonucleases P/MRP protein subunit POP1-like [Paramacrobiotus metropolitanus]
MSSKAGGRKRKRDSSIGSRAGNLPATGAGVSAPTPDSVPSTSTADTMDVQDQATPASDLNVIAFAEKRSREIRTLLDALSTAPVGKQIFQQLPRHMRRRAMSYNIKRLPKRLRGLAAKQTSQAKIPKRHRKKYRKRPGNKKIAYAKRQTVNQWLETHVWHAKRFHMLTKWGYKVADYPNDKGFRAAFRASAEECLMTDMSYLVCMELEGPEAVLLEGIQQLTASDIGRTFAFKDYRDGHLEGTCILYEPQKYPFNPIGPVKFIWQAALNDSVSRKINLWLHPCITDQLREILVKIFQMELVSPGPPVASDVAMDEAEKLEIPAYVSADCLEFSGDTGIILRILKKQFVRLRLTGPKSTLVLKNVLLNVDFDAEIAEGSWKHAFGDPVIRETALSQASVWKEMSATPNESAVRNASVLGLIVRDPRLALPASKVSLSRISATADDAECSRYPDRSKKLSFSLLWNGEVRERVRTERVTDQEMNRRRSALPVPGMDLQMGVEESWIPVVLIRNSGYNRTSRLSRLEYGAGWDIIMPSGWGMSFWIPLVYNGARVCGQRDLRTVSLHELSLQLPFDFPDSKAGIAEKLDSRKQLEAKHQRYPPNKRPNFLKLGVASPFLSPWNVLFNNWIRFSSEISLFKSVFELEAEAIGKEDNEPGFHIIRNLRLLAILKGFLGEGKQLEEVINGNLELFSKHRQGLVPVVLNLSSGGAATEFALICAPTKEDLECRKATSDFGGPVEPKHPDPFRKSKARERRKLQMEKLLGDADNVLDQCSRKTIGYVIKGGFSFICGHNIAVGFCSLIGFLWMVRDIWMGQSERKVLVRSAHSFQYRFADVEMDILDVKF